MHTVGRLADTPPGAAGAYTEHSEGYRRHRLVDRGTGSLHQEVTIAALAPVGKVERHMHAFEEAIYMLEGRLSLAVAGSQEELAPDDYAVLDRGVPHALRNHSGSVVRWLEVSAPQPGAEIGSDTVFVTANAAGAEVEEPFRRGRFNDAELPPPSGDLGLAGFGGGNVGGARLRVLLDRDFGATQLNLLLLEYVPGGEIREHDHPFEEAFFFLSGEIEAVLDGTTYTLHAGDFCWSGVRSMHSFANRSNAPVRWLETQVPQPPLRNAARFKGDWQQLAGASS